MKFDYIVGNPPYNRGINKPHHPTYHHPAVDQGREGYMAFILKHLPQVDAGATLSFVIPGKFLVGTGCIKFRRLILKHKLHIECLGSGADVFGIRARRIVVLTISPGTGVVTEYNGVHVKVDHGSIPNNAIPVFINQDDHDSYVQEVNANGSMGKPNISRSDVVNTPRVMFDTCFAVKHIEALDVGVVSSRKAMTGWSFDDNDDASAYAAWLQTPKAQRYWDAFEGARQNHLSARYLPKLKAK